MKIRLSSPLFFREILGGIIILSIISFTIYLGVVSASRAFINLEDLNYVGGYIADREINKHTQTRRFGRTTVEDVLVLRIEGSDQKFGFLQSSKAFKALLGFHSAGNRLEIYYDPDGEHIKENVTLHIFDLKVGQAKIIDIQETKRDNRNLSIFFFGLYFFLLVRTWIIFRKHKKRSTEF